MVKKENTTKSTKRFKYTSFKSRIDDLKIEPAKNLEKRVHDYVKTSHFLASFEHWKDINLSGNFTAFVSEVEPIIQTLPQILYHQNTIYQSLIKYIAKNDEKSLQPLLDLLSQFVHDLGPDFMSFYNKTIDVLVKLLNEVIVLEDSNVFEWTFNSLAYIFKYLSRILTEKYLIPTFDLLFPLLSHSKDYLSRFSAETLSFLIRKSKSDKLTNFVRYIFNKLATFLHSNSLSENNLYDGLLTLFTESLITTSGSLHSKTKIILRILLNETLNNKENNNGEKIITLICDIWMEISRHASYENLLEPTNCVLEILENSTDGYNLMSIFLSTLLFAESGQKIPDWSRITKLITRFMDQIVEFNNSNNIKDKYLVQPDVVSLLFILYFRNCDIKNLTQFHIKLFNFILEQYSDIFLYFYINVCELVSERLVSFNGVKFLQNFIDKNWEQSSEKIALFLLDINNNNKTPILHKFQNITIPTKFADNLLLYLSNIKKQDDLFQIYWRLSLLSYVFEKDNYEVLLPLLKLLTESFSSQQNESDFLIDTIGILIGNMTTKTDDQILEVLQYILPHFKLLQTSSYFINGLLQLLQRVNGDRKNEISQFFAQNIQKNEDKSLLLGLTDNLIIPDSNMRVLTLKLLNIIMEKFQNITLPQVVNECSLIEQIPLTLQNGRILTARIRSMGEVFIKIEPTEIITNIFLKHLFGLLTMRFAPIWEGIREIVPIIYRKNASLTWFLLYDFLKVNDINYQISYPDNSMDYDVDGILWNSKTPRLENILQNIASRWVKYTCVQNSIMDIAKNGRAQLQYPPHVRAETLKIMLLVPQLVESNSRNIVPFLFNEEEFGSIFGTDVQYTANKWSDLERNNLLRVFAKFNNSKNIYKSEAVFQRLLVLLSSRTVEVQKLALAAILPYKVPVVNKFKDNLRNLLDDTLFKDEIMTFLSDNSSNIIQPEEREELMVLVLRILFGRAQTPVSSGIKKSRKHAVLSILPNLGETYITKFFELGSTRFKFDYFFSNGYQINELELVTTNIRRMIGYVTIINQALAILGSKYLNAILSTLKPLLYCIAFSYAFGKIKSSDTFINKQVSNLRQQSLRALNSIFQVIGNAISWTEYIDQIFNIVIKPRIPDFANENLQQPSSLLKIIIFWTTGKEFYPFLYFNDFSCVRIIMDTLSNEYAKESVVSCILEGSNHLIKNSSTDEKYVELVAIIASTCLQILPKLYEKFTTSTTISTAVDLLLNMTELGYVQDNETRKYLLNSLYLILTSNFMNVPKSDILNILKIVANLIVEYDCQLSEIEPIFIEVSKLLQTFSEKGLRLAIVSIISNIAVRFVEYKEIATIVTDLNSYSTKRMHEYDFPKILSAFEHFCEEASKTLMDVQWLPILHTCLYYIKDQEELALRTNATYCLTKFIDFSNAKISEEEAHTCVKYLKMIILPAIRDGLRKTSEDVQAEYITLLEYIVKVSVYYSDLQDMRVLLADNDEEANFFINIKHIQLHRRQRAIRRLGDYVNELSSGSIAHYLIPILEYYVFSKEEKYRNIANESFTSIGKLAQGTSWNQYRALLRRYISILKTKEDLLKESVLLVNQLSLSLKTTLHAFRNNTLTERLREKCFTNVEEPESFIKNEVYPVLCKILGERNDETIVVRIPLTEALVNFILALSQDDTVNMLPGILTAVCQILRSKSEELRDAIRNTLGKISVILGSFYLPFIFKELKSALQRGSQVHVLGFTVHHILKEISQSMVHADLDDSAHLLVMIIMEDIFGTVGQEKESDNYHTKMKEVKVTKSYDAAEILACNISLGIFAELLYPIKALLMEKMNNKTQHKLDELLRRYSLGLNKNESADSKESLTLCYEIFQQSIAEEDKKVKKYTARSVDEKEEFFLVNLNFKNTTVQMENSIYTATLQKFALDLLKIVISKHYNLLHSSYLEGFMPLLKEALDSENENVLTSALRVLVIIVKLDFSEDSEGLFKNCARKVLNLIKDSPSTSTELCQMGLKYLSSFIRHKDMKLKDTAISYILTRVLPDLNEPSKQGLAFNFLKALVHKHIMLPEIYDVIDVVREIMVTNHSKDIRDVSRSVYYQFLMEYDQGKGRLEKQFKYMVDNLQYPSQEGRQSVMELLNLIITKSNPNLLSKLSSSFFLSLSNVSINDESPRCREMASILLSNMLQKVSDKDLELINKYLTAWLRQVDRIQFTSLGLRIFKIYISALSIDKNLHLKDLALKRIQQIVTDVDAGSDFGWDLIYTALNIFITIVENTDEIYQDQYRKVWDGVNACLLYPHMWVRQSSARLVNLMVNNLDKLETPMSDSELQNIANRVMHQLAAPSIPESLSSIIIKTLVFIANKWNKENTQFIVKDQDKESPYKSALDYMVSRISVIIRNEQNMADSHVSKKASIQFFAFLAQLLPEESIHPLAEKIILSLYVHLETDKGNISEEKEELSNLSQECLQVIESKLSVSDFTKIYANVKQIVIKRRQERKHKRSILALNAPDIAAQKKIKKHVRSREKRKHEKDDSGYYQRKNKKKRV